MSKAKKMLIYVPVVIIFFLIIPEITLRLTTPKQLASLSDFTSLGGMLNPLLSLMIFLGLFSIFLAVITVSISKKIYQTRANSKNKWSLVLAVIGFTYNDCQLSTLLILILAFCNYCSLFSERGRRNKHLKSLFPGQRHQVDTDFRRKTTWACHRLRHRKSLKGLVYFHTWMSVLRFR